MLGGIVGHERQVGLDLLTPKSEPFFQFAQHAGVVVVGCVVVVVLRSVTRASRVGLEVSVRVVRSRSIGMYSHTHTRNALHSPRKKTF